MTEPKTLRVPGATLTYDLHGDPGGVPLLLIGSPMDAGGFLELAAQFDDRFVVTYDPRGTARSPRASRAETDARSTNNLLDPFVHADDLHALVTELGGGPVDVFASSGGAINALAWVERYPEDLRVVVAHEPPVPSVLPDRAAIVAAMDDIAETYQSEG